MRRRWARNLFNCCIISTQLEGYSFPLSSKRHSEESRLRATPVVGGAAGVTDITLTVPPRTTVGLNDECPYPSVLHHIHVVSLLSDAEAATCLELAVEYAQSTGRWDEPDYTRHSSYATCDFPVEDCTNLEKYLERIQFHDRLWDLICTRYDLQPGDLSYLDFFCAHYQAQTDNEKLTMDRLEAHRDGSLISFTLLLNPPDQFQGGGTFYDALRDLEDTTGVLHPGGIIRPHRAGDVVLQAGKLLHGAEVVRSGNRTVLVGFIDVEEWRQRPGVLTEACKEWGRLDVAKLRQKRQNQMTQAFSAKGWFPNNSKYLNAGKIKSAIRGFCPAFSSVDRRVDCELQRRIRLQTEDVLLRRILLPAGESRKPLDLFGGDITVL